MAEIGIVASVIQIADVGLRLSLKLYTFGETVDNTLNLERYIAHIIRPSRAETQSQERQRH